MLERTSRALHARWRRMRSARSGGDRGMSTAEYAVGTLAACGFATVLYRILTSDAVKGALQGLVEQALHGAG